MTPLAIFLESTFWETISQRLRLETEEAKHVIKQCVKRIQDDRADVTDFSKDIQHALDYYSKNIKTIEDISGKH